MLGWTAVLLIVIDVFTAFSAKPNIIFILTDDQDITLGGMEGMKKTLNIIVNEGITFNNSFVSSPICCVSRSSIMSGRYVHNHGTRNNSINGGCSSKSWQINIEPTCMSVDIQNLGYTTFYSGKYLNQYGFKATGGPEWIPKGWDHWFGLIGNSKYYNYSISNNGIKEVHGDDYYHDYYTDLIHNQSIDFIDKYDFETKPLFMILATPAAHGPFTPAPKYKNYDQGMTAPRIPNWNNIAVNINKHDLFRKYIKTPMNNSTIKNSDQVWVHRHGTLQSVDDMIQDIYDHLKSKGVLQNTYFVYFSDNGFQDGQFGQGGDKRQLFENDIRIPFFIAGPGITKASSTDYFALNIDIAPTLIELAGGTVPEYMDGQSLKQYIIDGKKASNIKQQFLIEYYGERNNVTTCLYGDPTRPIDSWNNTYDCVRMINGKQNGRRNGTIYCKFKCYDMIHHVQVQCPDKNVAQFYGSMYDLDLDYYQLNNTILDLNTTQNNQYINMMKSLLGCSGQSQCNALRQG